MGFTIERPKKQPEAFSANYEDSANLTLDSVRTRIQVTDDKFILGAFHEDVIVGMIGFVREHKKKLNHKGTIWGTYVAREFRGQGIGLRKNKSRTNASLRLSVQLLFFISSEASLSRGRRFRSRVSMPRRPLDRIWWPGRCETWSSLPSRPRTDR